MARELDSLRDRIDQADHELLDALARRMEVVEEILQRKEAQGLPLFDSDRETSLLTKVAGLATQKKLDPSLAERVLKEVINHSREVQSRRVHQERNPSLKRARTVAFQGTKGAYSWMTCRKHFGESVEPIGYESFPEAIDALESGTVDLALLPIENVLAGTIYEVYDLLTESQLHVVGEEYLRIEHCLIGLPDTPLEQIRSVLSHPVALQQCTAFIKGLPNASYRSYIDSAEAVRKVEQDGDPTQAAIASAEAAELYGLTVLRRGIADHTENYTRFWIISRDPVSVDARIPAKISLLLVTDHSEGALVGALSNLAAQGMNLTKLESRPRKGTPWQYQFHLEMEGNTGEERVTRALNHVRARARVLRVLGCFPSARVGTTSRAQLEPGEETAPSATKPVYVKTAKPLSPSDREEGRSRTQISIGPLLVGDGHFATVVSCPGSADPDFVEALLKKLRRAGQAILQVTDLRPSERERDEDFDRVRQLAGRHQIPLACEAHSPGQLLLYSGHADLLLLPSRQMHNISLLEAAGGASVPVLLKRGVSSTVRELLSSANTILERGNQQVILCERGIRTFESTSRTTMDLGAVLALKDKTHLPVFIDPTQCVTRATRVPPLVQAARGVGADGAVVHVAVSPAQARRFDLTPELLSDLIEASQAHQD